MKKTIIAMLAALGLALGVVACGGPTDADDNNGGYSSNYGY